MECQASSTPPSPGAVRAHEWAAPAQMATGTGLATWAWPLWNSMLPLVPPSAVARRSVSRAPARGLHVGPCRIEHERRLAGTTSAWLAGWAAAVAVAFLQFAARSAHAWMAAR